MWCTVIVFEVRMITKGAFVDEGVVVEVDEAACGGWKGVAI